MADPPRSYSIYDNYNSQGEGGGMFAPPHIAGWQPSRDAVSAWTAANHPVTPDMIDSLRQPVDDSAAGASAGNSISFGTKQGVVPSWALRSLAQGGGGSNEAQRNAIATAMMNQQGGAPAAPGAAAPAAMAGAGVGTPTGGASAPGGGMLAVGAPMGSMGGTVPGASGGQPGVQGQQIGERWDPQDQVRRMAEMQKAMGSGAGW